MNQTISCEEDSDNKITVQLDINVTRFGPYIGFISYAMFCQQNRKNGLPKARHFIIFSVVNLTEWSCNYHQNPFLLIVLFLQVLH